MRVSFSDPPVLGHDERQSLFVNVDHAEGGRLVSLTLVVNGEEHHLVPREAVPLLLGNLQDQRDQFLLVLLCSTQDKEGLDGWSFDSRKSWYHQLLTEIDGNFIANDAS